MRSTGLPLWRGAAGVATVASTASLGEQPDESTEATSSKNAITLRITHSNSGLLAAPCRRFQPERCLRSSVSPNSRQTNLDQPLRAQNFTYS